MTSNINWPRVLQDFTSEELASALSSLDTKIQASLRRKLRRTSKHRAVAELQLWRPEMPAMPFGAKHFQDWLRLANRCQMRLSNCPFVERDFEDEDREFQVPTPAFGPCKMHQPLLKFEPWSKQRAALVASAPQSIDASGRHSAVAEVFQSTDLLGRIVFDCLGLRALLAAGAVCWTWLVLTRRIAKDAESLQWSKTYGRSFAFRLACMINAEGTLQPDKNADRDLCVIPEELEEYDDMDGTDARAAQWIKERRVGFAAYCNPGEEPSDITENGTTADFDGAARALLATPSGAVICSHGTGLDGLQMLSCLSPEGVVSQDVRFVNTKREEFGASPFSSMACDEQHLFLADGRQFVLRNSNPEAACDVLRFTQIIKIEVNTLKPVAYLDPEPLEGLTLNAASGVMVYGMAVHGYRLFIAFNATDTPDVRYDKLVVYDHSGASIVADGVITGSLARPRGLVVVGAELFVCDYGSHRVVAFDAHDGIERRSVGGHGTAPGRLSGPQAICAAGNRLVVSELCARRVQLFSLALHPLQVLRMPGAGMLRSLCYVPRSGCVYVVDALRRQVHVLAPCRDPPAHALPAKQGQFIEHWEAPELWEDIPEVQVDMRSRCVYTLEHQPAHLQAANGVCRKVPMDESWRAWRVD